MNTKPLAAARRLAVRQLRLWVINADNYRGPAVADELRAVAAIGPAVIAVLEATGNPMPVLDGYRRIADDSRRSRGNIVAYVRDGYPVSNVTWFDLDHGWPRTEGPGQHEPRSILAFALDKVFVIIAHHPPSAPGADQARDEHMDLLVRLFTSYDGPILCAWDSNGGAPELCRRTKSRRAGRGVDNVVHRGCRVVGRYRRAWGRGGRRVTFRGDHRHVYAARAAVPGRYLAPRRRSTGSASSTA